MVPIEQIETVDTDRLVSDLNSLTRSMLRRYLDRRGDQGDLRLLLAAADSLTDRASTDWEFVVSVNARGYDEPSPKVNSGPWTQYRVTAASDILPGQRVHCHWSGLLDIKLIERFDRMVITVHKSTAHVATQGRVIRFTGVAVQNLLKELCQTGLKRLGMVSLPLSPLPPSAGLARLGPAEWLARLS